MSPPLARGVFCLSWLELEGYGGRHPVACPLAVLPRRACVSTAPFARADWSSRSRRAVQSAARRDESCVRDV